MKKAIKFCAFTTIFFALLIFSSCGQGGNSGDAQKVELEIQLSKNICQENAEKYPDDIINLSQPLQIEESGEIKANWAFYPLNLKRVDLGKTIKLDYLTNKAGNDKKIKFVVREHRQYFEENMVDSSICSEGAEYHLEGEDLRFIKDSKHYFVYSSNERFKIDGKIVYYSVPEILEAIGELLQKSKPKRIVIVYEPEIEEHEEKHEEKVEENTAILQLHGARAIAVSNAKGWKDLYYDALVHIHPKTISDDIDHRAGHVESYSFLVDAAKKAIETNQKAALLAQLQSDLINKRGLYTIFLGHEKDWNGILENIKSENVKNLDAIIVYKENLAIKITGKTTEQHEHESH